jgi:hypothetical protein
MASVRASACMSSITKSAPAAVSASYLPGLLIAQGQDPVFVSRQLGHANPAITLRVYSHLFDAARHAERARQGLEDHFRDLLI